MSAESLMQGSTSVKDSVTPFSVMVKLSAPANAAAALSRSAAAATRSVRERRIVDLLLPSECEHYLAPAAAIQGSRLAARSGKGGRRRSAARSRNSALE